jgi:hypothetical protein
LETQLREATDKIAHVIIGKKWPARFAEIEWPCLIWLNWIVAFGEFSGVQIWPEKLDRVFYYPGFKLGKEAGEGGGREERKEGKKTEEDVMGREGRRRENNCQEGKVRGGRGGREGREVSGGGRGGGGGRGEEEEAEEEGGGKIREG